MAGLVADCFDLINRTADFSRALAAQNVNQLLNDFQVRNCERLLNEVDEQLESYEAWLSKLTHISAPQTGIAKLTQLQSKSLVTNLTMTLEQIEAIKQHAYTATFPTTLKVLLDEFRKQFDELSAKLKNLNTSINELYQIQNKHDADIISQIDSFKFTNMVQPNPLHVFLDFQSEDTPECQLKNAIFQEGPDKTVSAVASGMGGIGKTCALRGVGKLEETKHRFPGGVLYMSLGAEAGKHELVRNLAEFVKQSGGTRASVEIGREENIAKAVTITAKWYEDHSTLFLIDDVWCTKGIDSTVTEVLAGLAYNSRSRVAFTTRDRTVRSHVKITFRKRGDTDAKKILLQSSGCTNVSESPSEQSAFKYLLNISDGLPIALGVIGKRARYLIEERSADELKVWELVREEFPQPDGLLLEDASRDTKNEKVLNVLRRSLEMADNSESGNILTDQFACFSVLRKRQEVPVDVLARMWGTELRDAKTQIEKLERFSIVELLHWFHGEIRMCFVVHDLFMDISRNLADDKVGFRVDVCIRLLNSYVVSSIYPHQNKNFSSQPHVSCKGKSGGLRSRIKRILRVKEQEQASSSAEHASTSSKATVDMEKSMFQEAWVTVHDDGYARQNVFRLLDIAGMFDEGFALLLDPRWVTEQVNRFGRKQFNDDVAIILKHVDKHGLRDRYAGCGKAIRMVKAAVTESEPHTNNAFGAGALWSQLYGRLINLRTYGFITSFVDLIDEFAPTPWVRSQVVLPIPTASTGKVMDIPHVLFLRSTSDYVDIVTYNREQRCLHLRRYFPEEDNVRLEKTWTIPSELIDEPESVTLSADASILAVGCGNDIPVYTKGSSRDGTCSHNVTTICQHKKYVLSISISADGKSLISGGGDGEVIMWRFTDSMWGSIQLEGHTDDVLSVKMCPNGSNAVSGGEDRTVRVWTQVEGAGWRSEVLQGHSDSVRCVDLSDDGRFVVTGSDDKIVRLWEKRSTEWAMSELEGHSSFINDVALDTNGMRIISASDDSTARLWECRTGVWLCVETLEGHNNWVRRVVIGSNRGEIFTSSDDGTVRMWDVARDGWETDRLNGHAAVVSDVAVSGDRRRVVSGSRDGTVFLWEKDKPAWKVDSLKKHSDKVNAVAISSDGKLIVSGSYDNTASVFEEKNGRWTSHELRGHTYWVAAVAISLDGKAVATASWDRTVKIWRKTDRSWKLSNTLEGHTRFVNSVALNRDGYLVVSGSRDRTVRVWDALRGHLTTVQTLRGHEEQVSSVAITHDGSAICSGDDHGTVKLWAQSAAGDWAKTTIGNLDELVKKLKFSPNGSFLRVEDYGGNLIWFAHRDGAWAEDSNRGGTSATDCGAFGDGRLDRQDWPHCMGQVLQQPEGMWNMGDGWYFAQRTDFPFAGIVQIIG